MSTLTHEEHEALTVTTADGFKVSPHQQWNRETREVERAGWSARYVGDGRYWFDASHGATQDEALAKARKARARMLAQREEDRQIEAAYGADAARVAGYARPAMPPTGLPDNLKPGLRVWVWGHGKARLAFVGAVSKTGKRARLIWVAPSNRTMHIVTASLSDLRSAS